MPERDTEEARPPLRPRCLNGTSRLYGVDGLSIRDANHRGRAVLATMAAEGFAVPKASRLRHLRRTALKHVQRAAQAGRLDQPELLAERLGEDPVGDPVANCTQPVQSSLTE
jgi:hypothetical protein